MNAALNRLSRLGLLTLCLSGGALMLASPIASADSGTVFNTGNATAHANFSITIPKFLYFQVGATGATATVSFDLTGVPANSPVIGTVTNGAGTGPNDVLVVVKSNNPGGITIEATNTGFTGGGAGSTPPSFGDIQTTTSNIPAPILSPTGTQTSASVPVGTGGITDLTDNWQFKYTETNVASPGTYTGSVTYTAVSP